MLRLRLFVLLLIFFTGACRKNSSSDTHDAPSSSSSESSERILEILNPLRDLKVFVNESHIPLETDQLVESHEKAQVSFRSDNPHLEFTLRYRFSFSADDGTSFQEITSDAQEWQGELLARDGKDTFYQFECTVSAKEGWRINQDSKVTTTLGIWIIASSESSLSSSGAEEFSDLEAPLYIDGQQVSPDEFKQGITFTQPVSLLIAPKQDLRYRVSIKESKDLAFYEITAPGGEISAVSHNLGKTTSTNPNVVTIEVISFHAGKPENALKKEYQFTVDSTYVLPQLLKDGKAINKISSFTEDTIDLHVTSNAAYSYSLVATSSPNTFGPAGQQYMDEASLSVSPLTLSRQGHSSVNFKVYVTSLNKKTNAKSSHLFQIALSKKESTHIHFSVLVNNHKALTKGITELNVKPGDEISLSVPPQAKITFDISISANNAPLKPAITGVQSHTGTLKVLNGATTLYRISVVGRHENGTIRKKEFTYILKPLAISKDKPKMETLIALHQKRLVDQLFVDIVKQKVEKEFYPDSEKDSLVKTFKNNNLKAQMESYNSTVISSNQRAALIYYKGAGYKDINNFLRFGTKPVFSHKCSSSSNPTEDVKTCVKQIDQIFAQAHSKNELTTTQDMYAYRGGFIEPSYDSSIPLSFTEPSYTSSSLDEEVAMSFYKNENNKFKSQLLDSSPLFVKKTAALWRIRIPKGTKVLYVDNLCEGLFTHEREILLPRNTTFKIVDGYKGNQEFFDYIPAFKPFAKCEICEPITYDAYRTINLELVP